jgi:hypothetical protein
MIDPGGKHLPFVKAATDNGLVSGGKPLTWSNAPTRHQALRPANIPGLRSPAGDGVLALKQAQWHLVGKAVDNRSTS